ncbi:MAG: DsbA family protein [Marinovum algicola]|uniref:Protein-disulfide isomerase n=1 Tax=Marinovum algicola TaxID=42444 RepID=A0A975ZPF8_9RHOB|nr:MULTISPECIES: DsbA family protein [Marinovum]MDD9739349.1 DsbA family protein [Marinovum sp. SP66]MDD9746466.1 DsbA family protein [Marinovum sp. PR37]SEJ86379.1 Protein-disulfide isomerase [Marinovum algicola]SLN67458.1 Disulfide bond formation protein D precursor [Marinovum algicola]
MKRMIPASLLALVLLAGGGWWLLNQGAGSTAIPAGALDAQEASEDVDTSTIKEMVLGAEDAPVTVIEYASYTCPHCANFHAGPYKNLKADYIDTGKIKFVYREVYFDRYGLWASMVARCGGEERFFGITDLIYKGQSDWVASGDPATIVGELRKIGRLAGLNDEALESCLQDGDKARTLVAWFEENAKADDISSTPSFVIDGELYTNMPYSEFQAILDEKLGDA